ncbi:MAG TPA: hypothetical protein VNQ77_11650 [Frankiaceae bacterium]|nr:hypothetical protein [Frankiaceae bacterium]
MRGPLRSIAVLATLALTLTVPAPASARQQDGPYKNPTVPRATDGQVDNDARVRADFGLRSDVGYVKKLYDDAHSGVLQASTTEGAILTAAEEALVRARSNEVDRIVAVAGDYFSAHRDQYSGMWVDQAKGYVGIGATDNLTAHQQALGARIGVATVQWDVVAMDVTLDHLLDLQRQVDLLAADLRAQSIDITSTSIDEEENKVYVAAASDTTTLRSLLTEKFSAAAPIAVEYEAQARLEGVAGTNSPPFRGGQQLSRSDLPTTMRYLCTSAFVAYQVERLDAAIFSINYFLTTAGHCETTSQNVGSVGAWWKQGDVTIGQSQRNVFRNGSIADAMAIPIHRVFKSNDVAIDPGVYRDIKCMMTSDIKSGTQGQIEMISGATTGGYRTGRLLRTHASVTYTDRATGRTTTLPNQHMTNYYSQGGDSGASVFGTRECTYRADGIHSGGTEPGSPGPNRKYYSPIFNVTKQLGLSGVEVS